MRREGHKKYTNLEVENVLRHVASLVFFDEQGEDTRGVGRADRGVGTNDRLSLCVDEGLWIRGLDKEAGRDGNQGGIAVGKLKDEPGRV